MRPGVVLGCLAVLLGMLLTINWTQPQVVHCLHVGEGPRKGTPEAFSWNPALEQEWRWAETLLPGHLLGLDNWTLPSSQRKNPVGDGQLLIHVNGDGLNPKQTPILFKAALQELGQRVFQRPSRYGVLEIRVFRQGLLVYRATLHRNSGGPAAFFVQQDWRCLEEATTAYPD